MIFPLVKNLSVGQPIIRDIFRNFKVVALRFLGCRGIGRVNTPEIELLIPGGKRKSCVCMFIFFHDLQHDGSKLLCGIELIVVG